MVKQDGKRLQRIRYLMAYAFDVCMLYGDVFLSYDKKACALALLPDKKRFGLQQLWLDVQLLYKVIGLFNVGKAMKRERAITAHHPKGLRYYLWFIGVDTTEQHKGISSTLLTEIIAQAQSQNRVICLETSTAQNLPWYHKHGFTLYHQLDLGYILYFFKR